MSKPAIQIKQLSMRQLPNGDIEARYAGKSGVVTVVITAEQMHRLVMRRLRQEAFA